MAELIIYDFLLVFTVDRQFIGNARAASTKTQSLNRYHNRAKST